MAEISRTALFGKLNTLAYKSIESATVFCKMRGNPYVELVHWIHQILHNNNTDLHCILNRFEIDGSHLAKDCTQALDDLPRGSTSISDLSSHVEEAVERAWVYGTLLFGEAQIRTGHLIVGILKTSGLRHSLYGISKEFSKIKLDILTDEFSQLTHSSAEEKLSAKDGFQLSDNGDDAMAPAAMGKQQALAKFSVDLTEKARRGELDPIIGRDEEIRQIMDILMRRRQNNPILTGEAGVGKTAVVEGFALRIASGDVPPSIKDVSLRTLDLGLLQAGASVKGEFENRLRQVIEEVQSSTQPIVLFIDEAHTLIGAGGAAGTGDAANLLKPALARGTLRTIAATTWSEYKKYFEKDPALTRRFQVIQVDEPSEEKASLMMRSMASTLEQHHKVQILDEALEASVKLSHRYIPARQLPDKSVSLLDTACARVAISQHAVPAEVEDCRRRLQSLQTEEEIIEREAAIGIDVNERRDRLQQRFAQETENLKLMEARWQQEQELVTKILHIRAKLRDHLGTVEGTETAVSGGEVEKLDEKQRKEYLSTLQSLHEQLEQLQGDRPLILPSVDGQAIANVVSDWTGIQVGRMVKNEIESVLNLAKTLNQRVIGQSHGLEIIAKRVQTTRAQLDNPNKPIGVFMLCGPSGVGKTETGLALAETLFGSEQNVITINMSEYQEAHTVSTLKGSPPGYVGYGEGGILTEAVRRKPYSVILLDEIEKAHPDVHEIFFQVFDKGWMEDAEGRYIDFKNTLILLTSNVGTELIMSMCQDPELMPNTDGLAQAVREPLLKVFPPALLGRLVVIPYYPLSDEMLGKIIELQFSRIKTRIMENHRVPLDYGEDVIKLIAERCTELESGARMVDAILTNSVLPAISQELLRRKMEGQQIEAIRINEVDSQLKYHFS